MTLYDVEIVEWKNDILTVARIGDFDVNHRRDRHTNPELRSGVVDVVAPGTKIGELLLSHIELAHSPLVWVAGKLADDRLYDDGTGTLRARNLLVRDTRLSPGVSVGTFTVEPGLPLDVDARMVGSLLANGGAIGIER